MYHGTAIYYLLMRCGMVIGADSKARDWKGRNPGPQNKIVVIRDSVAVACEGLGMLTDVGYVFEQFVLSIEPDLPADINARVVARALQLKLPSPFNEYGKIHPKDFWDYQFLHNNLTNLVIASVADGVYTIARVFGSYDSIETRVKFGISVKEWMAPQVGFEREGVGCIEVVEKIISGEGNLHDHFIARTNGKGQKLFTGQEFGCDELADILRWLLTLQSEATNEQVGPPFLIATLRPDVPITLKSYSLPVR